MIVINKAAHKLVIYNVFLENGKEKRFPLAKLKEASSLMKKIMDDSNEQKNDEGIVTGYGWDDSDLELVLDEAAFLKEQLNAIQTAAPSEYERIESLKELLS